ncbi:MAG: hypothetical protein IPM81_17080 [Saprospirales bacterium]|nr:hypothetical protein [Saprospirales bacterium]
MEKYALDFVRIFPYQEASPLPQREPTAQIAQKVGQICQKFKQQPLKQSKKNAAGQLVVIGICKINTRLRGWQNVRTSRPY